VWSEIFLGVASRFGVAITLMYINRRASEGHPSIISVPKLDFSVLRLGPFLPEQRIIVSVKNVPAPFWCVGKL
jgi:hypothetical protein